MTSRQTRQNQKTKRQTKVPNRGLHGGFDNNGCLVSLANAARQMAVVRERKTTETIFFNLPTTALMKENLMLWWWEPAKFERKIIFVVASTMKQHTTRAALRGYDLRRHPMWVEDSLL
jgi:hypothetical protein